MDKIKIKRIENGEIAFQFRYVRRRAWRTADIYLQAGKIAVFEHAASNGEFEVEPLEEDDEVRVSDLFMANLKAHKTELWAEYVAEREEEHRVWAIVVQKASERRAKEVEVAEVEWRRILQGKSA